MCICMYLYFHLYMCVFVCVRLCAYVCTCVCGCVCACMCVYVFVCCALHLCPLHSPPGCCLRLADFCPWCHRPLPLAAPPVFAASVAARLVAPLPRLGDVHSAVRRGLRPGVEQHFETEPEEPARGLVRDTSMSSVMES